MVKRDGITTIQMSKETVQRLARMAEKGDTYEDVVRALLDFAAKHSKVVDGHDRIEGSRR